MRPRYIMYPQKLLTKNDRVNLLDHLLSLSDSDRYLRFGYPISSEQIEKYVERSFDLEKSQWFGMYDDDERIVASVHAVMVTSTKAEMGLTVNSEIRNQGLGQMLFDRGLCWARSAGAKQIYMQCLTENKAIQHIARKNNMSVAVLASSEREGVLKFNSVSIIAPLSDVTMDHIAAVDACFREQRRTLKTLFSCWL